MTREGRLHNRVSLVTGAARGIGLAAARALAQEGARVMMCDVDADVLQIAADELPLSRFSRRMRALASALSTETSPAEQCWMR